MKFAKVMGSVALFALLPLNSQAGILVSTYSPDGTMQGSFAAGPDGQITRSVKVDGEGNIWVARNDVTHGGFVSVNDKVVKYTPAGAELLSIKGPMQEPFSIAFDSQGNIYVGGQEFANNQVTNMIFKYASGGTFVGSFGQASGEWRGVTVSPTDRVFGITDGPALIKEFTVGGAELNSISVGGARGKELILSEDGSFLWAYEVPFGVVPRRITAYNFDLSVRSSFSLASLGNVMLTGGTGLATLANGNLVFIEEHVELVYELTPTGQLVRTTQLTVPGDVWSFTVDRDGNFVVGSAQTQDGGPASSVPEPASFALLGLGAMGLAAARVRRAVRRFFLTGGGVSSY